MDYLFYLLNVTVSGVKNLKQDVRINFYKKTVDKSFEPKKYRIKAIYGENGAGKSALITSLRIFQDLLIQENYLTESKTQNLLGEIINKQTNLYKFNCEFLVNFLNTKTIFNYSVHLGKNNNGLFEIIYEKLMCKNAEYVNNNYKSIFEIKNGEIKEIDLDNAGKEFVVKDTWNLLSTHPLCNLYILNFNKDKIEREKNNTLKQITASFIIFMIFSFSLRVYLGEEDQHELYFIKKRLRENKWQTQFEIDNYFKYIEEINKSFSINERKINKKAFKEYKEKIEQLTQFIRKFKPELVTIEIDKKINGEYYECDLILNYGKYKINKEFESTGIKKLIRLFDCFMEVSNGGIVFIDEMDSNLNDVYLCRMLEYFMQYGKGQLCFTTHNIGPMSVLKKNKNSIDFLSSDNHLVSWTARGNALPENYYRNGMIKDLPFNVDATDFIGIFGE